MYIISKIGKLVSNMLQTTHRDVKKINRDNESYFPASWSSAGTKCYENDKSIATINWPRIWTN